MAYQLTDSVGLLFLPQLILGLFYLKIIPTFVQLVFIDWIDCSRSPLYSGFFRFYKINLFEYQLIKNNFVYINIFVYFCNQQIN
jgi:hypothetical protein